MQHRKERLHENTHQQRMVAKEFYRNKKAKQWQSNYQECLEFAEENNHLKFSHSNPKERRLASWLSRQKTRTHVSPKEKELLEKLEPYYDKRSQSEKRAEEWNKWFHKMMAYKEISGDFVVSKYDRDNQDLRGWMIRQRKAGRDGKLSNEQRGRLEDVGFVFTRCKTMNKTSTFNNAQVELWDKMYDALRLYKQELGHCDVPFNCETHTELSHWVSAQRSVCRKGGMDTKRKERLDELGFTWNKKSKTSTPVN